MALAFAGLLAPIAASAVSLYFTIEVKNDRQAPAIVSVSNSSCQPFYGAGARSPTDGEQPVLARGPGAGERVTIVARVHTGRDVICEGLWREGAATVRGGRCTIDSLGQDLYLFVVK